MDINPKTGIRKHAKCPKCKSLERHRLQFLVMKELLQKLDAKQMNILHFAPEPFFSEMFSRQFGMHKTADLNSADVDYNIDIQKLPFENASFDVVFASHVMEHIPDDKKAIREIYRILKPNGIAILPVPFVAEKTVEYPEPNPFEYDHMRAPGLDYFDRYKEVFQKVDIFTSAAFPEKYQLFTYEDRSKWPTIESPLRPPMKGKRHLGFVPVCYV